MQAVKTTPLQEARIGRGVSIMAVAMAAGLQPDEVRDLEAGDLDGRDPDWVEAALIGWADALGIDPDLARELAAGDAPGDGGDLPTGHEAAPALAGEVPDASAVNAPEVVVEPAAPPAPAAPVASPSAGLLAAAAGVQGVAGGVLLRARVEDAGANIQGSAPRGGRPAEGPIAASAPSLHDDVMAGDAVVSHARSADPEFAHVLDATASELEAWTVGHVREVRPTRAGTMLRRSAPRLLGGPERAHRVATGIDRVGNAVEDSVAGFRRWLDESSYGSLVLAAVVGIVLIAMVVTIAGRSAAPDVVPAPAAPATQEQEAANAEAGGAGAEAEAAPERPAQRPILPRTELQVDVLNAGSVPNRAAQVASGLERRGYNVRDVGNSSRSYSTPVVLFAPGHRREALRMGRDANIGTIDQLETLRGGSVKLIVIVR